MREPRPDGVPNDEERAATLAARLRVAFDLADTGVSLMRENLRRRHPEATVSEIDGMLRSWLRRRPPDGPGRIRELPTR